MDQSVLVYQSYSSVFTLTCNVHNDVNILVPVYYVYIPRATHSSGVRQSYSVSSNTSRGRNDGKDGMGGPPFGSRSVLDVCSDTGMRSEDWMLTS